MAIYTPALCWLLLKYFRTGLGKAMQNFYIRLVLLPQVKNPLSGLTLLLPPSPLSSRRPE
jgi:hypothetical protein